MTTDTADLIPTAQAIRHLLKGELLPANADYERFGRYHDMIERLILAALCGKDEVLKLWRYESIQEPELAAAVRGQRLPTSTRPPLFGVESIEGDTLVWVASREARMLVEEAGMSSCVIVPAIPPTSTRYRHQLDYLLPIETQLSAVRKHLYLLPDTVDGRALRAELARRIGPERAWLPVWPSECETVEHIVTIYGIEVLREVLASMQPFPIRGIITLDSLRQQLRDTYEGKDDSSKAVSPGWKNLEKIYRVRQSEITLVQGPPHVGKSTLMSAMLVNMIEQEQWAFTVFSPEHGRPVRYAETLLSQYTGWPFRDGPTERMSPQTREDAITQLNPYVSLLWPEDDMPTLDLILELARQEVFRRQIKGVVIDPWGKLIHQIRPGQREDQYIAECLTKIHHFASQRNVHVWIVVHPTKLPKGDDNQYPVPKPYDISGGCHDEKTEVLTSRGWLPHADITLDDEICCFDLQAEQLIYQKPLKVWSKFVCEDLIRIQGQSIDALVTKNHRLVVQPAWQKCPSFLANYVGSGHGHPQKYHGGWTFIEAQHTAGTLLMPWATPLSQQEEEYPISDDALQFIGWWIAEGWHSMGSVALCQAVGYISEKMHDCLQRLGFPFNHRTTHYRLHEQPMWIARLLVRYDPEAHTFAKMVLDECGHGADRKRLPSFTWHLSTRQKHILLMAYLEGDGSRKGPDSYEAKTVSTQLANDLQRLAIELGRMALVTPVPREQPHHQLRYSVNIGRAGRQTMTLRRGRHMRAEHYEGMVYCLTVPTGAYVVRRNGKPGIYGNSAWFNYADNILSAWRPMGDGELSKIMHVHTQKIRFPENGIAGKKVSLRIHRQNSRFSEVEG